MYGLPNRAAIVRGDVRVAARAELVRHHAAELVRSLVLVDLVNDEAPLRVVEEAEVLVRLLQTNNVHEPGREAHVRPDLVVHLHHALHADQLHLLVSQRVLQALTEENRQRYALTQLVRTAGGARGPITA